jgi:hypothetical protein
MRARHVRLAALGSAAGVLSSLSLLPAAHADEKQICAQASEEAQQLRTEGRPKEARDKLLVCVRDVCPQIVRKDCTLWLAEVTAALPSVVVGARDAQGHDVLSVQVSLDGKPFASKVDGKAIAVNPGAHTFRFELPGAPPVEEKVVIREGEKNRDIVIAFKTPGAPPAASSPAPPEPVAPRATGSHGPPVLTYVFGGLGVLAAGGYAYFGIKGKSDVDNLRSTCAPECTQSQKDSASTELLAANVLFGVGVAAIVAAAIVWLVAPSAPPAGTASAGWSPVVDLRPLAGGGIGSFGARF